MNLRRVLFQFILLFMLSSLISFGIVKDCGGVEKCQCGDSLIQSHYFSSFDFLNECRISPALLISDDNVILNCDNKLIESSNKRSQYSGIIINSSNVSILNCNLSNFHNGIEIINASNIEISNSNLSNNYASGIDIRNSTDIIIRNSTIFDNWDGIFIRDSKNILIANNSIQYNLIDGIHLFENAHSVEIKLNDLSNNDGHAIAPVHCSHIIDDSNYVDTKLVKYYSNENDLRIDNENYAELIVCNVNNSIFSNLEFENSQLMKTDGILSVNSHNNEYVNLSFKYVRAGIYFYNSRLNQIKNVEVYDSNYGLRFMKNSSYNVVENASFLGVENIIYFNMSSYSNYFDEILLKESDLYFNDLRQNNSFQEILISDKLTEEYRILRYFEREEYSLFRKFLEFLYDLSLMIK